jgi:hypothetical protein
MLHRTSVILAVIGLLIASFGASAQSTQSGGTTVVVPKGTVLKLTNIQPLDSSTAKVGDAVPLRLTRPLIVDGVTLLPEGTSVVGKITKVKRAGLGCQYGSIQWKLDRVPFADSSTAHTRLLFARDNIHEDVPFMLPKQEHATAGSVMDDVGAYSIIGGFVAIASPVVVPLFIKEQISKHNTCSHISGEDYLLPAGSVVAVVVTEKHRVRQ